jgi:aspartate racemase
MDDDRPGLSGRLRPARARLGDTGPGRPCLGEIRESSRDAYLAIIERLAARGCDAAALVCTEIPLLVTAEASPLPILDSTRLLAAAAVEVALGLRPLPEWRGGPFEA